jgi:hypothetical protein
LTVIPVRHEVANPESMIAIIAECVSAPILRRLWLWIPGSSLRSAPE